MKGEDIVDTELFFKKIQKLADGEKLSPAELEEIICVFSELGTHISEQELISTLGEEAALMLINIKEEYINGIK